MKRFLIVQLFLLSILSNGLFAQSEDISLLVSVYGSIPSGQYSDKIGDNAKLTRRSGFDIGNNVGLAQTGYGVGIQLDTGVFIDGLSWLISLRFLANPTDGSAAESRFNQLLGDNVDFNYETGTWIHIPVMTGFRYKYKLSPDFSSFVLLQGGVNLVKAPSRTGTVNGIKGEDTEFKFARDFGFEIGLGVELYNKWSVGLSYLLLNTPSFEGTRVLSEKVFPEIFSRKNEIIGEERSVSMFLLNLGYFL